MSISTSTAAQTVTTSTAAAVTATTINPPSKFALRIATVTFDKSGTLLKGSVIDHDQRNAMDDEEYKRFNGMVLNSLAFNIDRSFSNPSEYSIDFLISTRTQAIASIKQTLTDELKNKSEKDGSEGREAIKFLFNVYKEVNIKDSKSGLKGKKLTYIDAEINAAQEAWSEYDSKLRVTKGSLAQTVPDFAISQTPITDFIAIYAVEDTPRTIDRKECEEIFYKLNPFQFIGKLTDKVLNFQNERNKEYREKNIRQYFPKDLNRSEIDNRLLELHKKIFDAVYFVYASANCSFEDFIKENFTPFLNPYFVVPDKVLEAIWLNNLTTPADFENFFFWLYEAAKPTPWDKVRNAVSKIFS